MQTSGAFSPLKYQIDGKRGTIFQKKFDHIHFTEGFRVGVTNNYGMLCKNISKKKSEKEFRVALIGDSYVEAEQVFDRHHFKNYLRKVLDGDNQYNLINVINFGHAGFDLNYSYTNYQSFVKDFNVDIALFLLENKDFKEMDIKQRKQIQHSFLYENNGDYIIDYSFTNHPIYYISTNFNQLLRTSYGRLLISIFRNKDRVFEIFLDKFYSKKTDSIEHFNTSVPPIKSHPTTIKIIQELGKDNKCILVFREQIDKNIEQLINKNNLRTISLIPLLDSLKKVGNDINYWTIIKQNGHWNHKGHKFVGEYIGKKLLEKYPELFMNRKKQ